MSVPVPGTGSKVNVDAWTGVSALAWSAVAVALVGASEVVLNSASRVRNGTSHGRRGRFLRRSLVVGAVAAAAGTLTGTRFGNSSI